MSCPDCITGGLLPGEPTGSIGLQGGYYAAAPEGTSETAVVYLADGFGLALKNCKILADNFAKSLSCDVWVPDFYNGKPLVAVDKMLIPDRAGVKMSIFQWLRFIFYNITRISAFIQSRPSVVDARIASFIKALQEQKKYKKIGAVGYCYGGAAAIRLASTGLVDSVVICHPGPCNLEQIKAIKVPAAWVCAEDDLFFSSTLRMQAEAALAERKGKDDFVEYEFKDYKGTAHGFAARPNLALPEVKEAYDRAFGQAVEWFKKTLADH